MDWSWQIVAFLALNGLGDTPLLYIQGVPNTTLRESKAETSASMLSVGVSLGLWSEKKRYCQ